MAKTDLETLVVRMEAQMKAFENELKRGRQTADTQTRAIEKRFADTNKKIASSFDGAGSILRKSIAALGVGVGIREVQQLADSYTTIQNSLKVAGLEGEALTRVYDRLFESAQKNAAPIEDLSKLYSRAATVQKELGVSTEELLNFTDKVAVALRVSGQSAEQSSGALLQLSQALGSGVVRAEEFNSILEGALPIAQAAAAGLTEAGGSVAKLRQLIVDGKVSSEAFFRAFEAGSATLEARASGMQATIGQATTRLQNAFTALVGKLNETTGASSNAATNLMAVARAIEALPGVISRVLPSMSTLEKKMAEMGNAPIWTKLLQWARQAGMAEDAATFELNLAARAGDKQADAAVRLRDVTAKIVDMEGQLNRAKEEGFAVDRNRMAAFEGRLAQLRQEREEIQKTIAVIGPPAVAAPPGARIAEGANDPMGRAVAPGGGRTVSLADFDSPGGDKKGSTRRDPFERALDSASKRIEVLKAETAAINEGTAARERAKLVAELEVAAKARNQAAGLKNIEVTAQQRQKIDELADSMMRTVAAAESANNPLAQFGRQAANVGLQLQEAAVSGLQGFEDALISVMQGSKDAKEAFRDMANAIIADLARIAIRQAITGPIASALGLGGGVGGIFGAIFGGGRALGGPVAAGTPYMVGERGPELFVPDRSGQIVPNNALRKGGGSQPSIVFSPTYQFDAGIGPSDMALIQSQIVASEQRTRRDVTSIVRGDLARDRDALGYV